jgi:cell division protein DivIC
MPLDDTPHRADTRPASGKGKKRRIRLFMLLLLGFLVWSGYTYYDQQLLAEEKEEQLAETEQKLAEIRELNANYKREIERLQDPAYIEQRIYKDLQMKKDGDTLYQVYP